MVFQIEIGIAIAISISNKDRDRDCDLKFGDRGHAWIISAMNMTAEIALLHIFEVKLIYTTHSHLL